MSPERGILCTYACAFGMQNMVARRMRCFLATPASFAHALIVSPCWKHVVELKNTTRACSVTCYLRRKHLKRFVRRALSKLSLRANILE